jgi:hypothetical protein
MFLCRVFIEFITRKDQHWILLWASSTRHIPLIPLICILFLIDTFIYQILRQALQKIVGNICFWWPILRPWIYSTETSGFLRNIQYYSSEDHAVYTDICKNTTFIICITYFVKMCVIRLFIRKWHHNYCNRTYLDTAFFVTWTLSQN